MGEVCKNILLWVLVFVIVEAQDIQILQKPIEFGQDRVDLTKAYIAEHYGKKVNNIAIKPAMIVLHWTGNNSLKSAYNAFESARLSGRKDIQKAGALNVSAHFLVDRDGTIYQLMPDNWMARHVIGLNYAAIGIENVGGSNLHQDLTKAQVASNIALVKFLKHKYSTIQYLLGHYEYKKMQNSKYWLEKDKGYRTNKSDPGTKFTQEVREGVRDLGLKQP